MDVLSIYEILVYFGLFITDSIFTPFYGLAVIAVAVHGIGKIIRGRMI